MKARLHVLWSLTVLTVMFGIGVMVSDLYLRTNSEALAAGARPYTWDVVGSLLLGAWVAVAWLVFPSQKDLKKEV